MKSAALLRSLLFASSALLTISHIHAADGTWLGSNDNWGTSGTWSGGTIVNAAGFTAYFTGVNITADRVITLDVTRTIGNITFRRHHELKQPDHLRCQHPHSRRC